MFKKIMSLAVLILGPTLLAAEPKNLSIQDIEFSTIEVNQSDTVRARIMMQAAQFKSISEKSLKVEVRFYSGKQKGQEKRIMEEKTYFLTNAISSFQLSPKEACPAPGNYFAKVWLSVRNNDNKYTANDGYKTYQESYPYTCLDRKKLQALKVNTEFKVSNPDMNSGGRVYNTLNLLVELTNSSQWQAVKNDGGNFEVRLYVNRDGQKIRMKKDKQYLMQSQKASYAFNIKDLCGDIQKSFWAELFESETTKEIEVSSRVTVLEKNGTRDSGYDEFNSKPVKFLCVK